MGLLIPIVLVAAQVLIPFFVGAIARDKGRSFALWCLFGVISPTWALFYVMLVDDLRPAFPLRRRKAAGREA